MDKIINKKIRLLLSIVLFLLLATVSFSNTIVKSEEIQKIQTENEQQSTIQATSITPLAKLLASFKFLNWNFWSNPPNIFSRNFGNVGIGGVPPSDAKLYVKTDNISMNYTIYAEGGLGIKSVSTIFEGTGITGQGGHAGVCGNGYIGLLGSGYYGGWFEGKGYFSGDVSIGTLYPSAKLDVNGDVKTSGEYKYTSPKTYYLNVPAAGFTCELSDDNYNNFGLCMWLEPPTTQAFFICPINLPQGATVTEFQTYIYDNHGTYDIVIQEYLYRRYVTDNYGTALAWITTITAGNSTNIQVFSDTTIINPTIDNENYQYYIFVDFNPHSTGSILAFYGARITYTMDTIAP